MRSSGRYIALSYARTGRCHRPEAERCRRLSDKKEEVGSTPTWSTTTRCEETGYFWKRAGATPRRSPVRARHPERRQSDRVGADNNTSLDTVLASYLLPRRTPQAGDVWGTHIYPASSMGEHLSYKQGTAVRFRRWVRTLMRRDGLLHSVMTGSWVRIPPGFGR